MGPVEEKRVLPPLLLLSPSLLLSTYCRDPRLMEALEKLRDDLLEDSAWPVIMQWFNEKEDE